MLAVEIPQATIIGNAAYLVSNFERVENGWIAYKIFNSTFVAPDDWIIKAGKTLRDPDLDIDHEQGCASGINIAKSKDWIQDFISDMSADEFGETITDVWKVFIPDTATIVIPIGTDGKIRTNEIQLLETVGQVFYEDYWLADDEEEF